MKSRQIITFFLVGALVPILIVAVVLLVKCPDEGACRWNFFRAFPKKWEGPQQNASSSTIDETAMVSSEEFIDLPLAGSTASPTNTRYIPPTATEGVLRAEVLQGARCRSGPKTIFPTVSYLNAAEEVVLLARDPTGSWLLITRPSAAIRCWVWKDLLEAGGDIQSLLIDSGPPLPTWTPEPAQEPRKTGCWVLNDPQYKNGTCKSVCGPNDQPATPCEL
jgi:hypothetical protein